MAYGLVTTEHVEPQMGGDRVWDPRGPGPVAISDWYLWPSQSSILAAIPTGICGPTLAGAHLRAAIQGRLQERPRPNPILILFPGALTLEPLAA